MNADNLLLGEKILELEKKLFDSSEALDRCKKENEEFILIASHDLQAPLRKLSTFVERLIHKSSETLGSDALLYIEKIQSTLATMRSLIDDLSALSEISEADFHFVQCDLKAALDGVIQNLPFQENGIDFMVSPLAAIEADPARIQQVFKHLIDNAIKFKNTNEAVQITIRGENVNTEEKMLFNLPPDKVFYKIQFTDNGIGFSQENANKIFNPFQRLHGKAAYGGNGLGLAICKKIIETHLGLIYATGKENEGAQFVLILPEMHT